MKIKSKMSKDAAVRNKLKRKIAEGQPGDRLPRVRDLMSEFGTSQRVVERVLAPLIEDGQITARPGAGLHIAQQPDEAEAVFNADCLILYRASESRLARRLLVELVNRLRRNGYRVEMKAFVDEAEGESFLERQGRFRCCLLQTNFEVVSVRFLARILDCADALVVDGVSLTGIDADVIGTNWREALSVGYRMLQDRGHSRIGFLTSAHDARQIAMARREFLLLSGWEGPAPHPRLHTVAALPGSYRHSDLVGALPESPPDAAASTALIIWGLVEGRLLDAALQEKNLKLGEDVSLLLLGSVDVPSEHVSRFDIVGNSDREKLDLFETVVTARIKGSKEPPRTHYLPIYTVVNGSIQRHDATLA
ncbi:GntR family transcriptional regulator [Epibacterium sp. Ofav1-8]|uniref:GntR family transcriptional regulator n=1 Tax=Epibacterium sp. Ofav1-8 TaxID=2917735 RepID=UPI001EF71DC0|nr:GntR family transcriptional regulator [Epibacterium sp. Ofav1-8]MCG7622162.1 GntR family transcriptional regulator [Epibacterium sp. Ofav1-8]